MKREPIMVQTVNGPREVFAWRHGALAIHRSVAVSGFTVTHAPSGFRLRSRIADKTHAFQLAENLLRLPIDWSAEHPFHDDDARRLAWHTCMDAPKWQRRSRAPPRVPDPAPEPEATRNQCSQPRTERDETMSTQTTQWEEVKGTNNANVLRWDTPGTVLEGVFQGGAPAGQKGNMLYTLIQAPDNTEVRFWETLILRERLDQVQPGQYVRIEYEGFRNKTKLFKVQVRRTR